MTDWTRDYWREGETDSEHAERVEAAIKEARWYFDDRTRLHLERYEQTIYDLAPYRGPMWERKRADALRKYRADTAEAASLFEHTAREIMQTGEVSPETGDKWSALEAASVVQIEQAAE